MNDIKTVSAVVTEMDKQLRDILKSPKMLWENTYIYHQLEKRKSGGKFTIQDHIRAMVYSMLSSGISWERVESITDLETGKLTAVDVLFHQYDPDYILSCEPSQLRDSLKSMSLASQYTNKQMQALINTNIPKLMSIEKDFGSIDSYYSKFIKDDNITCLVRQLSSSDSMDKLFQMGEALTAEYLKNVGYDLAKPDRHICRILGSNCLACSDSETVPLFEAFEIVSAIAKELNKPSAEVDYILWAYCANGYGEICTVNNPKCEICKASSICKSKSEQ